MNLQSRFSGSTSAPGRTRMAMCFLAITFLFLFSPTLQAQFVRQYGDATINETGNVLLPERDGVGNTTGNLFIGGTRGDASLIMLVDPTGLILNEWLFKVCNAGEIETMTDLRYDRNTRDLVGCGRVPAMLNGTAVFRAYAFRFDPTNQILVWGNRFTTLGAGSAIIDAFQGTGSPSTLRMFGIFYAVNAAGGLADHEANYVYLDFANGNILAGDRVYTNTISSDDHNAAEYHTVNNEFVSTGRWAYNAGPGSFRSNYFLSDNNGNLVQNRMLFGNATPNMRLYGMDVLFDGNDPNTRPVLLTSGDFTGATTVATNFALSVHDFASGAVLNANQFDLSAHAGEFAQEVIYSDAQNLVVFGNTNTVPRDIFIAEIDAATLTVNWANTYDSGADEFATATTQSQMVLLNNSYYYIANLTDAGNTDIILAQVLLDGTNAPCSSATEPVDVTPQMGDFDMNSTFFDVNTGVTNIPPVADPQVPEELVCGETCFAEGNQDYLQITTNITISGYTAWPAKVYVDDAVVVTVTNGTLDVTNSDVVFGPCASILISTDGNIRLNNSVLRPCDERETWLGLRFENEATGVINTSTFKNAINGIDVVGDVASPTNNFDVRITDNTFINCLRAINVNFATLAEGITGNRFTIDERRIEYNVPCEPSVYAFQHVGIMATNSFLRGLSSQNSFVNTSEAGSTLTFFGVLLTGTSAVISKNSFSNMFEAVSLTGCRNVTVENNDIELTMSLRTPPEAQIRLNSKNNTVWITGNQLVNVVESYPAGITPDGAAIYMRGSTNVNCKENGVQGFVTGIFADMLVSSNISENKVTNADLNGIVVTDGSGLSVGCNEIRMRARTNTGSQTIGISYTQLGTTPTNASQPRFFGNCVFNADIAMQTNRVGTLYDLPQITNNYFFNYAIVGVNNINFTGFIGTALAPYTATGHNTFVSNNVPNGVFDVASNVAIATNGNWGINNPGPGVGVAGNGLYNSNTACGNQTGVLNQEYLPMDYCDQFTDNIAAASLRISRGDYGPITELAAADPNRYALGSYVLVQQIADEPIRAAQLHAFLMTPGILTQAEATLLDFKYKLETGDLAGAEALVGAVRSISAEMVDFANVYEIVLQAMLNGRGPAAFSTAEVAALQAIDDARGPNAELAREYLQIHDLNHNYIYSKMPEAILPQTEARTVNLQTPEMFLAPNPATESVRITYVLEQPEDCHITVCDMLGRVLVSRNADANYEYIDIDVSTWAKGIYNVNLSNAKNSLMNQKLIKQ